MLKIAAIKLILNEAINELHHTIESYEILYGKFGYITQEDFLLALNIYHYAIGINSVLLNKDYKDILDAYYDELISKIIV